MKRRKVFELLTLCAMFMTVSPMGVLAGDMGLTGQGKEATGESGFQDRVKGRRAGKESI